MDTDNPLLTELTTFLATCGVRDLRTRTVSTPIHRTGPVVTTWEVSCRVIDPETWIERTIVATAPDLAVAMRRMTAVVGPGTTADDVSVTTVGLACPRCGDHEQLAAVRKICTLSPLKRRTADPKNPKTVTATTAVFYMNDPTDDGERCGLYISADGFDDDGGDNWIHCRRCGHENTLCDSEDLIDWGGTLDPVPTELSTGATYYAVTPKRTP